MAPDRVSAWVALGAGLLSFFSPCVLPLVPAYLLYMTGMASDPGEGRARWGAVAHAAFFVVGFGLVFVLGGITVGLLGSLMPRAMGYLARVGGAFLILFGLHMTGLIAIPLVNMDRRLNLDLGRLPGYGRSFVMGLVFAAGWTPCIGPALGAILSLAAVSRTVASGAALLGVYSVGIAVPFLLVAALSDVAVPWLRKMGRHTRRIAQVAGGLLIVMGLLLVTGTYQDLIFRLNAALGGF